MDQNGTWNSFNGMERGILSRNGTWNSFNGMERGILSTEWNVEFFQRNGTWNSFNGMERGILSTEWNVEFFQRNGTWNSFNRMEDGTLVLMQTPFHTSFFLIHGSMRGVILPHKIFTSKLAFDSLIDTSALHISEVLYIPHPAKRVNILMTHLEDFDFLTVKHCVSPNPLLNLEENVSKKKVYITYLRFQYHGKLRTSLP